MQSVTALFVIIATVFAVMSDAQSSTIKAVFYDHTEFGGSSFEATIEQKNGVKNCANLPDNFNDFASSVNTLGNCVMAFDDKDCKGARTKISPETGAHNNLGAIGWNDRISSVNMC